jgi:inorganic pyrophosphatase
MALLDEGETDWKVIVVDVNDSLASKLNDIEDVERNLPGLIRATNEWFRCIVPALIVLYSYVLISRI